MKGIFTNEQMLGSHEKAKSKNMTVQFLDQTNDGEVPGNVDVAVNEETDSVVTEDVSLMASADSGRSQ